MGTADQLTYHNTTPIFQIDIQSAHDHQYTHEVMKAAGNIHALPGTITNIALVVRGKLPSMEIGPIIASSLKSLFESKRLCCVIFIWTDSRAERAYAQIRSMIHSRVFRDTIYLVEKWEDALALLPEPQV